MSYYIGIDGGGTKTAYALFNEKKEILCTYEGPGSNHENLESSFEGASDIIVLGVFTLCKNAGIILEDVDFTLMGLAGIDHPYQHDAMYRILADKGLKNFEIYNDGFLVVKAGSETGAAIGYNCGTGVCCNCIDSDGKMLQLAGLGNYTADWCGGIWIAEQTFRVVYDEVFAMGEKSIMTKKLFERFNLSSREDMFKIIQALDEDSDEYRRPLLDIFFEAVEEGDSQAMKLIETMTDRGALFISALAKQMNFAGDEIEVILSGSINVKLAPACYIDKLVAKSNAMSPKKLKFINLDKKPVYGCINWILQEYVG